MIGIRAAVRAPAAIRVHEIEDQERRRLWFDFAGFSLLREIVEQHPLQPPQIAGIERSARSCPLRSVERIRCFIIPCVSLEDAA